MTTPNTYRAAIIGVGAAQRPITPKSGGVRIGYTHAAMYRGNPRTQLVAAADLNPENLAVFCQKFEVPNAFDSHRKMLDQIRPDIVSIATGMLPHCELIEAACEARLKLILCEKPFVASPAQLVRVKRAVEKSGAKLA